MNIKLRLENSIIAPSILSADCMRLAGILSMLNNIERCHVHIDVMDGIFVPNITMGIPLVASMKNVAKISLDCHLMIINPIKYILQFINAGANWVSIHQEADIHCHRTLNLIRSAGAKAGIALNPGTPVEIISDLVGCFDFVLIMSVNPGFSGQEFIPNTISKIRRLDAMRTKMSIPFAIQVDGGITMDNAANIIEAGADVLVIGNAIFNVSNQKDRIMQFLTLTDYRNFT